MGLTVGLNRRLNQVKRAQEKLDEGSYGVCDRCGQDIGESRLAAIPEAVLCVACQARQDKPFQGPLSEAQVLPYSFSDGPAIGEGEVEADREDFWQSVAQFGTSNSPQDTPPAVDYHETFIDFDEPIGIVEDVEAIVDENGEVLFDALRERPRQMAESSEKEDEEISE